MKTIRRIEHIRLTTENDTSGPYVIRTRWQVIATLHCRKLENWRDVLQRAIAMMDVLDYACSDFRRQHPIKSVKAAIKAVNAVYTSFRSSHSASIPIFGAPHHVNEAVDRLEGVRYQRMGRISRVIYDLTPHPGWDDTAHFCIDV